MLSSKLIVIFLCLIGLSVLLTHGCVDENDDELGNIDCPNNERLRNEYLKAVCIPDVSLSERCANAIGVCFMNLSNRDDPCVKSICDEACGKCGCD